MAPQDWHAIVSVTTQKNSTCCLTSGAIAQQELLRCIHKAGYTYSCASVNELQGHVLDQIADEVGGLGLQSDKKQPMQHSASHNERLLL